MRLGLAYEMQRPVVDDHAVVEETIAQCVLADEMGFDTVWFDEVMSSIELFGKHVIPELRKSPAASSPRKDGSECARG